MSNEDFRTCDAQTVVPLDFDPPTFRVNAATDVLHTRSPRFGHPKDINVYIQGTNEEQRDYVTGLMVGSILVFCLFVVWMSVLWVFKWLGPTRVGFLSAFRQLPTKPEKPDAVYRQERYRKKQPFQRNGQAGGYESPSPTTKKAKKLLKPVVGVAKAPITVVSKARKRKRELEKRNQFSKMKNDSFDENEDDNSGDKSEENYHDSGTELGNDVEYNEEQAPSNHHRHRHGKTRRGSSEVLTEADRKIIRQYELDWKEYERLLYQHQDRILRIRIAAGFCAVGILISALLFTIMTQKELTASLKHVEDNLDQASEIIEEANTISANLANQQFMAKESTRKFFLQINDICPNAAIQLCANVSDATTTTTTTNRGCNFSSIPFGQELTNMVDVFDNNLDRVIDRFGNFNEDLADLQSLLADANAYYPKHAMWAFWTAAVCALLMGCIAVAFLAGMVYLEMEQQPNGKERKLPERFSSLRSKCLVPLFLLLVILSWSLTMFFIFVGVGSSDLCYNSPDTAVLNILENVDFKDDSLLYLYLRYFVSGCPTWLAPDKLDTAVATILEVVFPSMGNLVDAVKAQGEDILVATCGTAGAPLLDIVGALGNQFCSLGSTIAEMSNLFRCEVWYPLYRVTMHDAVCMDATQGFAWAAATQMVLVVLSFILLTLRVSFYELEEALEKEEDAGGSCCPCLFKDNIPTGHIGEINIKKESHIGEINMKKQSHIGEIDMKKQSHIGEINMKKQSHIGEINMKKQSHIGEINMKKQTLPTQVVENQDAVADADNDRENDEGEDENVQDQDDESLSSRSSSFRSSSSETTEEISLKG